MSQSVPKTTIPYLNQGSKEAMLGDAVGIPMTIDGTRFSGTIKGPCLYARASASPYKAKPFCQNAAIINPTNSTNATVDIADADAVKFRVGDSCTFYDVSAAGFSTETLPISAIGAAGSGGAGETLVTFTGTWSTPPTTGDKLVVSDGTQLSARAVVVCEDITFDGTNDFLATGYLEGMFKSNLVNNTTYFVQHENQKLRLLDIQG